MRVSFCPDCRRLVLEGFTYCPYCGKILSQAGTDLSAIFEDGLEKAPAAIPDDPEARLDHLTRETEELERDLDTIIDHAALSRSGKDR